MHPQSFVEQALFSTVRIELFDHADNLMGFGTGFLLKADLPNEPNQALILLISNKHVFAGSRKFDVSFHRKDRGTDVPNLGHTLPARFSSTGPGFCAHSNPNVDLACVNLSSGFAEMMPIIYYKWLDKNLFATFSEPELDLGQRVVFVGYPENRFDQKHNLPILRSGTIASHPRVDFNGESQFIIDAQVFPGSSGSPVFLNMKEAQFNRGIIQVGGGVPYLFLGVVSSTMIRNNIVDFLPTQLTPSTQEVIGLGLVFKANAVKELIDQAIDGYLNYKTASGA